MTSWDVVIVGGGSAGCVLAARLSEDPARSVLLLEAGASSAGLYSRIPAAFSRLFHSRHDWALATEPEPHLDHRHLYWPRGRVLGGCSAMNAMLWVRGQQADYDGWAGMGATGWGWHDVLPHFRRAEDHTAVTGDHVGLGGPVRIGSLRQVQPLTAACLEAARQTNLAPLDDLNTPDPEGFGLLHVTQRRGERESAATAYLRPARGRPNLTVRTGATVLRVSFEGQRATGVVVASGPSEEFIAAGEVILSAGAIHSPQLLMLSGVGPAGHLQQFGIEVVADLPGVGRNLQDHLAVGIGVEAARPVSLASADRPWHLMQWLLTRSGPLTSTVAEAAGFFRSSPAAATPDMELIFAPTYFFHHGFENPKGHGFTLATVLLRPESRGTITLQSADPTVQPLIHANYLSGASDLPRLLAGLHLARRVAAAPALAPWRGEEKLPGPGARDDDALAAHIRANAQTLYHPVGTCRMGADEDAVVDPALRVRGVTGLRVVDASVMPAIISGHTNAPTIMIAERASALMGGA